MLAAPPPKVEWSKLASTLREKCVKTLDAPLAVPSLREADRPGNTLCSFYMSGELCRYGEFCAGLYICHRFSPNGRRLADQTSQMMPRRPSWVSQIHEATSRKNLVPAKGYELRKHGCRGAREIIDENNVTQVI